MGCLFSRIFGKAARHETLEEEQPKVFSWDKRPKVDVSSYMFDGLKGETVGKLPGSLNGTQFIIQNCENCNIYIFDHTSTVTVDDCVNCNIFIGPIKTSIFIRDCTGCKFVLACQQFRLRDCHKLDAFLCCATQPIIESSSGVRLACYSYYYPELAGETNAITLNLLFGNGRLEKKGIQASPALYWTQRYNEPHYIGVTVYYPELAVQFREAGLSVFNNNWSNIHDFTQDATETHYTLLPEDSKVEDFVPLPTGEMFEPMHIDLNLDKSVVPRSMGNRRKTSDESCLVVFFYGGNSQERALSFIDGMRQTHPECVLVQTKELKMQSNDAQRVFGTDLYKEAVSRGLVIGLEYNGEHSIQVCQEVVMTTAAGSTGLVFVSQSRESAQQQIHNYYDFADMQMSV